MGIGEGDATRGKTRHRWRLRLRVTAKWLDPIVQIVDRNHQDVWTLVRFLATGLAVPNFIGIEGSGKKIELERGQDAAEPQSAGKQVSKGSHGVFKLGLGTTKRKREVILYMLDACTSGAEYRN